MINYGNPVSGYVDYKFGEVGEVRRQRYLDNFYASEAVRQAASDLEAAPFEGDMAYRDQLLQNTDNVLNSIAEKGDYENLTVAVSRAATGYQKRAKPLQQNLTAYQSYKQGLDKLYEEQKIDYEDYTGTMNLAMQNYNGLQMDENGNASNYFTGVEAVHNPDIAKMLKETLSGMVADSDEQVIEVLGQGPDGMYQVKTTQGIKTVSPDRVENAMRMVMEDPRVTSYITRKAEIRVNNLERKLAAEEKTIGSALESTIESADETLAQLDQQIAGASGDRRAALEASRDILIQKRGDMQKTLESGDEDEIRAELKDIERNRVNAMYDSSAKSRYGFTQQEFKQEIDYDKLYLQRHQQAFESTLGMPNINVTSGAIQMQSEFGTSDFEVMDNMNSINDQLTQMQKEWDQDSDNWDESRRDRFARDMASLAREVEMHRSVLEDRYERTNPGITQSEQYKELQKEAIEAEQAYRNSQSAPGRATENGRQEAWQRLRRAERNLEEHLRKNQTKDPAEGRRTVDLTMSTAQNIPGIDQTTAKGIQSALDSMLSVPPSDMLVYAPNSTEQTTIADLGIPPDAKLVGAVTLSTSVDLPGVGRIAQARYQTDEGIVVVNIPIQGQINIPALNQHLNSPYMQTMSAVQRLEIEGVRSHSFPIRSRSQGISGQLVIDYETGEAKTIFGEHESESFDINSEKFKLLFEENGLELY